MEDFFKKNEVATVRLSPNGKYLAYLKYHGEHYNIFTKRVDGKGKETQITKETERDAGIFFWKGEETLVIFKYLKNEGVTHIFRTSATGKKEKNITPKKGVSFSFVHDSPPLLGK